jgi:hypothetical protein
MGTSITWIPSLWRCPYSLSTVSSAGCFTDGRIFNEADAGVDAVKKGVSSISIAVRCEVLCALPVQRWLENPAGSGEKVCEWNNNEEVSTQHAKSKLIKQIWASAELLPSFGKRPNPISSLDKGDPSLLMLFKPINPPDC